MQSDEIMEAELAEKQKSASSSTSAIPTTASSMPSSVLSCVLLPDYFASTPSSAGAALAGSSEQNQTPEETLVTFDEFDIDGSVDLSLADKAVENTNAVEIKQDMELFLKGMLQQIIQQAMMKSDQNSQASASTSTTTPDPAPASTASTSSEKDETTSVAETEITKEESLKSEQEFSEEKKRVEENVFQSLFGQSGTTPLPFLSPTKGFFGRQHQARLLNGMPQSNVVSQGLLPYSPYIPFSSSVVLSMMRRPVSGSPLFPGFPNIQDLIKNHKNTPK